MNPHHLRAFHAVAEHGGFTAAAAALHVSQPTLSEQVRALERAYRVSLLRRVGRGVELTELGAQLHAITADLSAAERAAQECLVNARGLVTGTLRVAADAPVHAMPLLGAFHRAHPGVRIALRGGNTAEVLADFERQRVDVAIVADAPPSPDLLRVPLLVQDLVALVPRGHRLAGHDRVKLADLAAELMVVREPGSLTQVTFERALAAAGVTLGETLEVDSREAALAAVAAGLGVGLGSTGEIGTDPRLVAVPLAGPRVRFEESLLARRDRAATAVVAAVLAVARSLPQARRNRPNAT